MITEALTPKERELMVKLQSYVRRNPFDVVAYGQLLFLHWKNNDYENLLAKAWNAVAIGLTLSREILHVVQRAVGKTIVPFNKKIGQWGLKVSVSGEGIEFDLTDTVGDWSFIALREWSGVYNVSKQMKGHEPEFFTFGRSNDVLSHLRAFAELHRDDYDPRSQIPSQLYDNFANILGSWDVQPKPRPPKYRDARTYQRNFDKTRKRRKRNKKKSRWATT